ncbi:hypothetical protein BX600DRAFT_416760 [Xylariales sp. PMI_506]|nr:hypothetical protein BX600DRAFT_416760 [Xylariales sp. PMI_506]
MAPRASNIERKEWRSRCRDMLANHIEQRIGISIPAADIRLITSLSDPYSWKFLPEVKHLFSKNLSDHSINAYKQVCQSLGESFEVLPNPNIRLCEKPNMSNVSFSSKVNQLGAEVYSLKFALKDTQEALNSISNVRLALEDDLENTKAKCLILEEQLQQSREKADRFEKIANRYSNGVKKLFPLLEEMRGDAMILV